MNVDEFKYRFLKKYRELEQLSISSMIPELHPFDLENQFIVESDRYRFEFLTVTIFKFEFLTVEILKF